MNAEKYQNIVDKHKPKEDKFYNGLIAFIVGGILGLISNFILNLYSYLFHISSKEAGAYMLVTFIFVSCV